MMPAEVLHDVWARLRGGIASGAYAEAEANLSELRRALEEALAKLPAGDPEAGRLVRETLDLLAWARRAALAARAQDAGRLARLRRLPAGYQPTTGAAAPSVQLEG